MRAIFVGLVAISFTLTAVGCGGDPCADYEKKLCADEGSAGACGKFKEQLAKAKADGTAGDMKKTCETSLANWDKRGEGEEDRKKAAEEAMAKHKSECEAANGTFTDKDGCQCADGKPPKIAKMDGDKPVKDDKGKPVYERETCPANAAPAPPKKPEGTEGSQEGAQGAANGDPGKKDDKGAAGDDAKKAAEGAEKGDAKAAEGGEKGDAKAAEGAEKGDAKAADGEAKGDSKAADGAAKK